MKTQLVSAERKAQLLGISKRTLLRWVQAGKVAPPVVFWPRGSPVHKFWHPEPPPKAKPQ